MAAACGDSCDRQRVSALGCVQRDDRDRRMAGTRREPGPMWYFDDGKLVEDKTTPGTAGHHGMRLPFQVVTARAGESDYERAAAGMDARGR